MPSIFIWKSNKQNTSKKTIRVYSGSNWILEDNDYSSKSYLYLEQIVISGFNDTVITFNIKNMPQDWTGSELLEVTQMPYELIKSDNYGTLEQIGNWMRFTCLKDIEYNKETLETELVNIQNWMNKTNQTTSYSKPNIPKNNFTPTNTLDIQKVHQDFKEFLIKFDINKIKIDTLTNQSINMVKSHIKSR